MDNKERIKDLESQIEDVSKKIEQFQVLHLKLQGAVEGLNILQDQSAPVVATEEEAPERELLNES